MQKIEAGKIVTFSQAIHSRAHGEWGTFKRTLRFPEQLPKVMADAMLGMSIHESTNIPRVELVDFEYEESLVFSIPRTMLKGVDEPQEGMIFNAKIEGRQLQGVIKEINDQEAIIDCNFPQAGVKNLFNNIHILNIRDQTDEEQSQPFKSQITVI